jgi:hypothetical protein
VTASASGGGQGDPWQGVISRAERKWFVELAALVEVDFEHTVVTLSVVAPIHPVRNGYIAPSFADLASKRPSVVAATGADVLAWVVRLRASRADPREVVAADTVVVELTLAVDDLLGEERWRNVIAALAEALGRVLAALEADHGDPGEALDAFNLFGPRP